MSSLPFFPRLRAALLPTLACLLLLAAAVPALLVYTRPAQDLQISYDPSPQGSEGYSVDQLQPVWDQVFLQTGDRRTVLEANGALNYTGLEYPGQTFYYSVVLDRELPDSVLIIGAANYGVAVFLDGDLLYTNVPQAGSKIGDLELPMLEADEAPLHISMPAGYQGKTLTIAQATSPMGGEKPGYDTFSPLANIQICSQGTITTGANAQGFSSGAAIAALFLLGCILVVLTLQRAYLSRSDWSSFFLALFVFLLMLHQVLSAPMSLEYCSDPVLLDRAQVAVSLLANTAQLCFLALHLSGRRRLLMGGMIVLQLLTCPLALAAGSGLLAALPGPLSSLAGDLPGITVCATLLGALLLCVAEWRRGNAFFTPLVLTAALTTAGYLAVLALSPLLWPALLEKTLTPLASLNLSNLTFLLQRLRLLFLICSISTALWSFLFQLRDSAAQRTALLLKEEMARASYQEIRTQVQETAILRHDIKKHLDTLSGLLSDGQIDRARAYLAQLTRQFQELRPIFSSGHYLMDMILNSRLSLAQERGIQVRLGRSEAPPALTLDDAELSALLLNALDNAIQAAAGLPEGQRWISLESFTRGRLFYIGLSNPIPRDAPGPRQGADRPGGREDLLHGYGLIIMRRIVERHAGLMDHQTTGGVFRLSLLLPTAQDAETGGDPKPENSPPEP